MGDKEEGRGEADHGVRVFLIRELATWASSRRRAYTVSRGMYGFKTHPPFDEYWCKYRSRGEMHVLGIDEGVPQDSWTRHVLFDA